MTFSDASKTKIKEYSNINIPTSLKTKRFGKYFICWHKKMRFRNIEEIVFANGLGDWGSIPGQTIPKTQKLVHIFVLSYISAI